MKYHFLSQKIWLPKESFVTYRIPKKIHMKYRENIRRNIEKIEAKLQQLDFYINRGGTREEANEAITESKEILSEVKSYVEREPQGDMEGYGLR